METVPLLTKRTKFPIVEKHCEICGAAYRITVFRLHKSRYCSSFCMSKGLSLRYRGRKPSEVGILKTLDTKAKKYSPHFDLSPSQLGYLAGFIDADGSISFRKPHGITLQIVNTHRRSLETVHEWLGFGNIYSRRKTRGQFGNTPVFTWHCSFIRFSDKLLRILLPYLRINRQKAECVLGLLEPDQYRVPMSWGYVAGFFDGEGSVSYEPDLYTFSFANTDRDILEEIRQFLGCGTLSTHVHQSVRRKTMYQLRIRRHEDQVRFIEGVMPYMIIKTDKASSALEWIKAKKWRTQNRVRKVSAQFSQLREVATLTVPLQSPIIEATERLDTDLKVAEVN